MGALGFLKNLVGGGKHDRDAKTKTQTATTTQTETREDEGDDDAVVAEVARGDDGTASVNASKTTTTTTTTTEEEESPAMGSGIPGLPPMASMGSWADFDEEETRGENPLVDDARRGEEEAA